MEDKAQVKIKVDSRDKVRLHVLGTGVTIGDFYAQAAEVLIRKQTAAMNQQDTKNNKKLQP